MEIVKSVFLFLVAGLCEIGGGYLVWLWLREGKNLLLGVMGGIVLVLYGVIPTLQPAAFNFGRVYAAYGGVFVVLAILWGWQIDRKTPDTFELIGGLICLIGVAVIMYWPRG
ncbi:MAG: YnfA family protein [Chloroflexota bacterium]